ncbi:Protein rotatin like [Pseudolycoriella hygida]|uniref:Protein rotatin like n=1 Tax=Pseudolycoriella hygida TaxID=35572 RepID=A0A9Q0NE31_9DIPT|nr:Protein rotatin like [Pseudolycoriella hygida]
MNNEVTTSTISKLGSEILEIRLRALKSVELAFKVYDQLIYNGPYLMKSLIEWFHLKPRREETCVLNLIHEILKGDQRDDTIYTFGLKKLQEKLSTIDQGLETGPQKDVMRKILLSLSSHEHVKDLTDTLTNTSLDEKSNFSMSSVQVDDLNIDSANALEYLDYVVPWDIPDPSDLNSLNLLKSSLRLDADMKDIMHAVSFLKTAIVDFPAEYFLQPPYIFQVILF